MHLVGSTTVEVYRCIWNRVVSRNSMTQKIALTVVECLVHCFTKALHWAWQPFQFSHNVHTASISQVSHVTSWGLPAGILCSFLITTHPWFNYPNNIIWSLGLNIVRCIIIYVSFFCHGLCLPKIAAFMAFRNVLVFTWGVGSTTSSSELKDHHLSAVRDCLFNTLTPSYSLCKYWSTKEIIWTWLSDRPNTVNCVMVLKCPSLLSRHMFWYGNRDWYSDFAWTWPEFLKHFFIAYFH
jgi:hypothetical protein